MLMMSTSRYPCQFLRQASAPPPSPSDLSPTIGQRWISLGLSVFLYFCVFYFLYFCIFILFYVTVFLYRTQVVSDSCKYALATFPRKENLHYVEVWANCEKRLLWRKEWTRFAWIFKNYLNKVIWGIWVIHFYKNVVNKLGRCGKYLWNYHWPTDRAHLKIRFLPGPGYLANSLRGDKGPPLWMER